MSLMIYNSRSREKEAFKPIEEGKIRMYVCGVTPYDYSHIGHARCYVAFDTILRYLRYSDYDVTFVRNYTDIDDKIIKRANEKGIEAVDLAAEFIEAYKEDMSALHVLQADHEPKVSETIQEIIEMVERIVENKMGYVVEGDVYFDINSMEDYGKLSGCNVDDLCSGARVEVDSRKKSPLDFALWKSAKPNEPAWDSPWGKGRPGWHIECSAMSQKFLGEVFDIHGGGKDLVFPHHENEIAQSEAYTGHKHVNYWMHNGFVNIDNEKMSKSLNNFFTIREVLKIFHPETLRLFLLTTHYRSPINYSDVNLAEARKRLDYFYETIQRATGKLGTSWDKIEDKSTGAFDAHDTEFDNTLRERFVAAMNEDFNAPRALGELSHLFTRINQLTDGKLGDLEDEGVKEVLLDGLRYVKEFGQVVGLWFDQPEDYLARQQGEQKGDTLSKEDIEALIQARKDARTNRDFAKADEIRDQLAAAGIEIKDSPEGTTWKYAN
ncbi:MAG TPA: cysteine--tRNA ligase [Myxococcales bacterium]|nr:cysteine--tRNA ligase [Deltaproteobacteria bacterium]MBU48503.1 cysteine--tRNA ligase [Deltaproteobacteria bacterium]HAA54413.1 cysteine--tRNA ligase [Myxococcales bacterium]|tara:strand:+ start:12772 stop:14250 length:1479 start_codon:yes stop_codon:yes gene_type:complete